MVKGLYCQYAYTGTNSTNCFNDDDKLYIDKMRTKIHGSVFMLHFDFKAVKKISCLLNYTKNS